MVTPLIVHSLGRSGASQVAAVLAGSAGTTTPGLANAIQEFELRLSLAPGSQPPGEAYLAHWRAQLESSASARSRLCLSSFGQLAALRSEGPGSHLYVWRDPADQWWSSRTSTVNDALNRIVLNFPPGTPAVGLLHDALGLRRYDGSDLASALDFYAQCPLSADDSFMLFYLLWCLALREAVQHADRLVNLNALACSGPYRAEVAQWFAANGYSRPDFAACAAPRGRYSPAEREWMHNLEHRVHGCLLASGWTAEDLEQLTALRGEFDGAAVDTRFVSRAIAAGATDRVAELADFLQRADGPEHLITEAALRRVESALQEEMGLSGAVPEKPLDDLAAQPPGARPDTGVELEEAQSTARRYAEELAALRSSFSWRITLPLRLALDFLAHPLQLGRRAWLRLRSMLLAALAGLLGGLERFVLARPTLVARVTGLFARFPRLRMLAYKTLAAVRSPQPAVPDAQQPPAPGVEAAAALDAALARRRCRIGEEYRSPLERVFS